MNETSDSSLSTLQLELESITTPESPLQQNLNPGGLGRRYTKDSKCVFCGKPVRFAWSKENKKGQVIDYYAFDCPQCNQFMLKYNLNSVEVDWMYFLQEGICANPGCTEKAGHIDHCHTTNKVREVLCPKCNQAFGSLNEDPQRLAGLIQYVANHYEAL